MTTETVTPVESPVTGVPSRGEALAESLRERIDLIVTPIFFVFLAATVAAVWIYTDLDSTSERILAWSALQDNIVRHINLTFWSTVLVVAIAVPLGIFITRPAFKKFAGPILGFANSGQAMPAFGLLVLFAAWLGSNEVTTAIAAFTVFALLPVLRNTMVGLQQVDQSVIEAGRGMGLSKMQALTRIELPLAVPVILAGVRTALVINVGMATLAFLIGAGGLGVPIYASLQLNRTTAVFIAGGLVAALALLVDFLAALAERYLRPKGI
ncbi:MAG TPA: ABC transporter permease [Acidimicrobiia bacterium]|nr:ABC transporter permease [Acidimicrobiia bacterium]